MNKVVEADREVALEHNFSHSEMTMCVGMLQYVCVEVIRSIFMCLMVIFTFVFPELP